ncbi:phosphoenolpyruvate-utilizing N-terminal domain-containing protein [Wukongibacter sp. M2B1]|uniref:phosphoenolpyruvate-utilizing N-terminal domain-containing protein n=1 Tax=Wukongibacter sp. M2B1 TaxID=3088895 RepID=UPI003D7A1F96
MKKGIGASAGIGIGKVLILDESEIVINSEKISNEELNNEAAKFKKVSPAIGRYKAKLHSQ